MSTIKGNPKKEKKPRSAAQLEATARLVKLNKERAVLRAEGKLPPVQRKKKTKTIIQELPQETVENVKPIKKKKIKKVVEPEPEPAQSSDCECETEISSQSSFDDDNDDNDDNGDEYYNYHCDDDGAEGVEDVYTEPPPLPLEPEPVEIVIVKPKRKRRVYK